jgi:hypothetical protein
MRATNIKATRGAVATIHSGSDRQKKSKTIESTLDQVPGDFHSKYTARARTLVTKMMFWALAGVTFSAAKIVSCNKKLFFHGLPSTLLQLFYFRRGHRSRAATRACSLIFSHCSRAAGPGAFVLYPTTVSVHAVLYPATALVCTLGTLRVYYTAVTLLL